MFGAVFWSSLEFEKKRTLPFLVKTFFWSSLNLLALKKSWSRFIPPMLKIGRNWGKIANHSPQCSTKIGTPGLLSSSRRCIQKHKQCTENNLIQYALSYRDVISGAETRGKWGKCIPPNNLAEYPSTI